MTSSTDDTIRLQIISILLAGAGLTLLAASPAVSTTPWSRMGSSLEWAVRIVRAR